MANANCLPRGPASLKKNNNELLQSIFFDGRRIVGPTRNVPLSKLRGVNQTRIVFCPNNVTLSPN